MAGGKLSPRQKMINLMYLVFIAMLAMNMSKEVLSAFGFMNEELTVSNQSTTAKNNAAYAGLDQKAQDQREKYGPLKAKADIIKGLSDDLYVYLDTLKAKLTKGLDDKTEYEAMDKTDFLDEYFFSGDNLSKEGQEFLGKINSYRDSVNNVLGSDPKYANIVASVNSRFTTDDVENKDGKKINWLKYKYQGFPLVASMTSFTQFQANVKNTENDVLASLLGVQLDTDSKLNTTNYKGIVSLDKTAYFAGEKVTGQVVLGRYDANIVPNKVVLNGTDITRNAQNGQVNIDMPAGNVGNKTIKGTISFMQDGKQEDIPFESAYSVIAEPNDAIVSADKMNVVYRGLDNPISISVPGVGDKDITSRVTGNSRLTRTGLGKYMMRPGTGNEVTINVSAKLSSGKTITTPKKFRIKDIPAAMGTVRDEFGVVRMPKSSLSRTPIGAGLPDFVFDLKLDVQGFTVKVPGQLAVKVNGTQLDARAKSALAKARRGDVITIFDIKATIRGNSSYQLKRVLPVSIEITN